MKILLIEDDEVLAKAIADVLHQQQHIVDTAPDGEIGLQCATHANYDLLLLDIILPKLDGVSLCRQLRQAGKQVPILLLTAKETATDKVVGLDAGADDYLIKPFDFSELLARIRALLRRGSGSATPILEWGNLRLDPSRCDVTYADRTVNLTSTEYRLLELFLRNSHRTFSRSAIVDHLWNLEDPPQEATIKSYIKTLRQRLTAAGAPADLIETIYGLGYRLKPLEDSTQLSESQQMDLAILKARESFKTKLSDRLTTIEHAIAALAQGKLDSELRQQAEHEAHKLAGSLGTFGFIESSKVAEAIEDELQAQPVPDQAKKLANLITQLRQTLDSSASETLAKTDFPLLLVLSHDQQQVKVVMQAAANWQLQIATASISAEPSLYVEQGLNAVTVHNPDAILLDLDCAPSFQDGLKLLSELSERSLRVLVWTAREELTDRVEVVRQGGDQFLSKSLPVTAILGSVAQRLKTAQPQAKVLLVDDDPQILTAMRSRLASSTLELITLETPEQFWTVLTSCAPDLIILDVEMPYLNGIELCRVIRNDSRWSSLPVLFLTAHTDTDTIDRIFAVGANDCVSKSITESKLLTRIFNCLERSSIAKSI